MKPFRYAAAVLLVALGPVAFAQEKLPDGAKVTKLVVHPAKVELTGPFAYSQLLVSATLETGDTVDVTRIAKITAPKAATVNPVGLVRPVADGAGPIEVTLAGQSAKVPLSVVGTGDDKPV
ncbi:MAG TPA: hypothetical protein VGE74_29430, partial [Gemmata sp.]